jgi:hypothetical protein
VDHPGPLYTLYDLESWPYRSCPYSRSTWKWNSQKFTCRILNRFPSESYEDGF